MVTGCLCASLLVGFLALVLAVRRTRKRFRVSFFPTLEVLEDRTVPAAGFAWTPIGPTPQHDPPAAAAGPLPPRPGGRSLFPESRRGQVAA